MQFRCIYIITALKKGKTGRKTGDFRLNKTGEDFAGFSAFYPLIYVDTKLLVLPVSFL
jgi:hypothetical protein